MHQSIAILIPAYQPDPKFPEFVRSVVAAGWSQVVVVNDGSYGESTRLFAELPPTVELLTHPVNRGKGGALKTGMAHILQGSSPCQGLITVDADGQHELTDISRLADEMVHHPEAFVLGVRNFDLPQVPFRNRLGNRMIRGVFWLLAGRYLQDTQTGLRGIPCSSIPALLELKGDRYEYELEMLLHFLSVAPPRSSPWREVTINTVYGEAAGHSHFQPLADSWKIFATLMRWRKRSLLRLFGRK